MISKQCLKSVQILSFFWSVFARTRAEYGDLRRLTLLLRKSPYSARVGENIDQKKLRIWRLIFGNAAIRKKIFMRMSGKFCLLYMVGGLRWMKMTGSMEADQLDLTTSET